jgi:hypothetical protein
VTGFSSFQFAGGRGPTGLPRRCLGGHPNPAGELRTPASLRHTDAAIAIRGALDPQKERNVRPVGTRSTR